jgi:hypothetical protein
MWVRGRLVTLLGIALVALSSGVAQAEIAPIAKPPASVGPLPKPHVAAASQPAASPQAAPTRTKVTPARTQVTPARTQVAATSTQVAPTRTVTPQVKSRPRTIVQTKTTTRRHQVRAAISAGGRADAERLTALIPPLWPAPLAIAGLDETLPSRDAWPDWLLALIAVTASAEAFLLTRLASKRRFAEPTQR